MVQYLKRPDEVPDEHGFVRASMTIFSDLSDNWHQYLLYPQGLLAAYGPHLEFSEQKTILTIMIDRLRTALKKAEPDRKLYIYRFSGNKAVQERIEYLSDNLPLDIAWCGLITEPSEHPDVQDTDVDTLSGSDFWFIGVPSEFAKALKIYCYALDLSVRKQPVPDFSVLEEQASLLNFNWCSGAL